MTVEYVSNAIKQTHVPRLIPTKLIYICFVIFVGI